METAGHGRSRAGRSVPTSDLIGVPQSACLSSVRKYTQTNRALSRTEHTRFQKEEKHANTLLQAEGFLSPSLLGFCPMGSSSLGHGRNPRSSFEAPIHTGALRMRQGACLFAGVRALPSQGRTPFCSPLNKGWCAWYSSPCRRNFTET